MKTIIGVVFLVFVIVIGMSVIEQNQASFYNNMGIYNGGNSSNSTLYEDDETSYSVTISGQVQKEGSYTVTEGSFLEDVIDLAGGLKTTADFDCFDYYLQIFENMEIYIPATSNNIKVSINSATADDLMELSGIGKTISSRIISYRENNGNFKYLEELMKVDGIGKAIFLKIRDSICL